MIRRQLGCTFLTISGFADFFDAVIDFDAAIRDPGHPARILPAFDGGDHLHPSDAGQRAMAQAIPLGLFDSDDH